jgi:hypothetical protein
VLAQLLVAGQGDHLHHVKVGRFAVDVVEAVGEAGREVGVLGGAAGALQAKRLLQGHPHRLLEVWKNFFFLQMHYKCSESPCKINNHRYRRITYCFGSLRGPLARSRWCTTDKCRTLARC